jgi:hypothetical protein
MCSIPVSNPLVLVFSSLLLSSLSKNFSSPTVSVLLSAYRNVRHVDPMIPIVSAEPMRHGRLGW